MKPHLYRIGKLWFCRNWRVVGPAHPYGLIHENFGRTLKESYAIWRLSRDTPDYIHNPPPCQRPSLIGADHA